MAVFTIDQTDALGKHISDELKKAARRAALSACARTVQIIVTELIPGENPQPVFDAHYKQAWRAEPHDMGADVVNTIPYASVIEYGARAENIKIGKAMIEALTEWVRRKGLVGPRPRTAKARATQEDEARQVAWAIAVSMKQKGIFNRGGKKGLRIAERASKRIGKIFLEEFARERKR